MTLADKLRQLVDESQYGTRLSIDVAEGRIFLALLCAAKAAKVHLEPDLIEPGRTVFWNLVGAIKAMEQP